MTASQFSRPGAIDLSSLRKPAGTPTATGAAPATGSSGGGRYSFDVAGEQALHSDVVERSMSVVVVVSFWSREVPASGEINATLSKLADEFAGRFLFARVDVGAQPDLAQALGIPQVPLVVAALRGQLAPLPIQESLPEVEMRGLLEQILQAAVANGVTGTAEPVGPAAEAPVDDVEPTEPESQFPEAEQALLSGDLDLAIAAYETALVNAPGNAEAELGLAQAQLLKRTQGVDPATAREAAAQRTDDISAQLLVADLDLMGGHVDDAFSRLIDVVRRARGDDRDAVRRHLIEMFGLVGDGDARVAKARQQLASALY